MEMKESCADLIRQLGQDWPALPEGERDYRIAQMVRTGCREVLPYLLRHLKSSDPFYRSHALYGLSQLKFREYREAFLNAHLMDADDTVRQRALIELGDLFRGERDKEILQLALSAFEDPRSAVGMRLVAGATMMYQLGYPHDEMGRPAWWDEEEQELNHPAILRAVEETRRMLKE